MSSAAMPTISLIHELTLDTERAIYQSVQLSEDEGEMILKVVNPNGTPQTPAVEREEYDAGQCHRGAPRLSPTARTRTRCRIPTT